MAEFALKNNLHVEFFIWCYLKTINNSGYHSIDDFKKSSINISSIKRKLKSNIFFTVSGDKIILKSLKNIPTKSGRRTFLADFDDLNKFARKIAHGSGKIIKGWNSTTIKYLMISVVACQYAEEKPYALKLIANDTGCSITIIQRALRNLFVERWYIQQNISSGRSFYQGTENKIINLSPNYYKLNIGKFKVKKNHSPKKLVAAT